MNLLELLFPWLCVSVLFVTVGALALRSRNRVWLSDTHLDLIAQPRLNVALGVSALAGSATAVLLGIVFVDGGRTYGWGFFALAADGVLFLSFYTWVARRTVEGER
jgi:hypothetical protein